MTTEYECKSNDLFSSVNLIHNFQITPTEGVLLKHLIRAELAVANYMFSLHSYDHSMHRCTTEFSIPEGYVVREGTIYKNNTEPVAETTS